MKSISMSSTYQQPIVIAMGFFDCLHHGHKALIEECKKMAKKLNAESAVTTFSNDPNKILGKEQQIYNFEERQYLMQTLGVDVLISVDFNEEFSQLSPLDALDELTQRFNIVGVIAGKDFKFGKDAKGDVTFLKEYMSNLGIKTKIFPFVKITAQKVSASNIKKYVTEGNVELINSYLTQPYFVIGEIEHGNERGRLIGYPTANIPINPDTLPLGQGVYATKVYIDNKVYNAVTNVGIKPTFGDNKLTIEAFILNFDRDIYGKRVRVEFYKKIREIIRFKSIPELQRQMKADSHECRAYFEKK